MKYRYRILYDDGEAQEIEASSIWIAMVKSGAILKDEQVVSVVRAEIPLEERIERRMAEFAQASI